MAANVATMKKFLIKVLLFFGRIGNWSFRFEFIDVFIVDCLIIRLFGMSNTKRILFVLFRPCMRRTYQGFGNSILSWFLYPDQITPCTNGLV